MLDSDRTGAIATLVNETRTVREALHVLIDRLRRQHRRWETDASDLAHRRRLTLPQRRRLCDDLARRKRS